MSLYKPILISLYVDSDYNADVNSYFRIQGDGTFVENIIFPNHKKSFITELSYTRMRLRWFTGSDIGGHRKIIRR